MFYYSAFYAIFPLEIFHSELVNSMLWHRNKRRGHVLGKIWGWINVLYDGRPTKYVSDYEGTSYRSLRDTERPWLINSLIIPFIMGRPAVGWPRWKHIGIVMWMRSLAIILENKFQSVCWWQSHMLRSFLRGFKSSIPRQLSALNKKVRAPLVFPL